MALANSDSVWEFDDFNGYEFSDVVEALTVYNQVAGNWDVDPRLVCGEPLTVVGSSVDTVVDVEGALSASDEERAAVGAVEDDSVVANLIAAIEQDDDVFLGDLEGDDDDDDDDEGLEALMEQLSMLEDEGGDVDVLKAVGVGEEVEEEEKEEEVVVEEAVVTMEFPENLKGMKLGEITRRIR